MSQSRPPTPMGGAIAMVLVGGAVATGVVTVLTTFRAYPSPELLSFRASTGFFLLICALGGLVTALGLMLCRPRGPVPPILAAVSGFIVMEVGGRIGTVLAWLIGQETVPDALWKAIFKFQFNKYVAYELLAVLIAGGLAALRVALSGGFGPAQQRPPAWTGPQPAGYGQPQPGQPGQPGMPYPGRPPMPPPGQPYGAPAGQPAFAPPPGSPPPGSQPPPPTGQPYNAPPPPDVTPGGSLGGPQG
ncbi:hypothetical protein [Actinomadura violacea]|uniref:Uncharacterized protein n=1 Tax=Actinomadura violacea TaxID=2819934 RepID=A0ABS3S6N0_9ACTN|nr:hypothetical protein [Actinomadura violacea]MBO2464668.1 hypothetical protein [Actinomadura violacea]